MTQTYVIVFYRQDDEDSDEITGVKLAVGPFDTHAAAQEAGHRLYDEHGEYDIAPCVGGDA